MPFVDRVEAGRQLGTRLRSLQGDVVVLALPRGGVPVGAEVARALDAPLDVILVRKLGLPSHPELAMGAIGEGGVAVANEEVIRAARITGDQWSAISRRESAELDRRAQRFRGDRPRVRLTGRTAVLVDDGIATGATALAACHVARALGAARVVLAAPVASQSAIDALRSAADEIVCLETPTRPTSARGRRGRRAGGCSAVAGSPAHPEPGERPGRVRPRQRQQPAQPPQPERR